MRPSTNFDYSVTEGSIALSPGKGLREKALRRLFVDLEIGDLLVILPNGKRLSFGAQSGGESAVLHLKRWRMISKTLLRGDLGFAAAFIDGDWDSPDLVALIGLLARNRAALARRINGVFAFRALSRLRHLARSNSRVGSRRNVEAHYDLGNDFYALWLDPEMIYSSAIWTQETRTLEQAQEHKLARISQLCAAKPDDRVLEIGSGWGALAKHMAARGARVTGLTLSPSQLEFSRRAINEASLDDRAKFELRDYRDATSAYDRVVSIEMIEQVGEPYMNQYFDTIAARLKNDGRAVIQAITISDDVFESYRTDTDFIQTYIFPGGFLPSPSFMIECAARAGLRMVHSETFGDDYARTLLEWRARFNAQWSQIKRLDFDEPFQRIWNYYLAYCAAGFAEGVIDVGLYVFEKKPAQLAQTGEAQR